MLIYCARYFPADVDECDSSPCDGRACLNTVGGYECVCKVGEYHPNGNVTQCEGAYDKHGVCECRDESAGIYACRQVGDN